ncbi:hypothetical protein BDV39DRAFT_217049 [Aspergillus sergii]|uniref:AAA-like domain protein n=1 Tax=Aspergillus sergii TaxID=1034303 RepID=A0A5N6WUR5_9EURO|nr:hypothetical protein BDV39DRAFT_217049 [Aspergillus sergii]
MSKKKSTLKADIRQAVRDMYSKTGQVDNEAIKSRFLAKHPGQESRINSVVVDYAFSLQQRSGKDVETKSGPSKTYCKQNENTADNCSLPLPTLGALKQPLSTLVLNFNEYSSNVGAQPCEAAFLSSVLPEWSKQGLFIRVRVLVPPSNFYNLKKMYSQIPNVEVQPFRLKPHHLNISTLLSLMCVGNGDQMPLYMSQVIRVLREMAIENKGGTFDYLDFRKRLEDLNLNRMQTPFLHQRLDLLDSYLDLQGEHNGDYFIDGGITILDLSCPFMDQATTCLLFRITIELFLHAHSSRGKMIVADEAHKYMSETPAAKDLTETFLNIIRQQRHLGVRTVISTQEPTISPRLIDLCSMTIIHRFTSPEWYRTIRKHITIRDQSNNNSSEECLDGLREIACLRTGEALVFAPSAYLLDENNSVINATHKGFKMAIRKRITWDGGRTIFEPTELPMILD